MLGFIFFIFIFSYWNASRGRKLKVTFRPVSSFVQSCVSRWINAVSTHKSFVVSLMPKDIMLHSLMRVYFTLVSDGRLEQDIHPVCKYLVWGYTVVFMRFCGFE